MSERKTEIVVGFTITLALLILAIGIVLGKRIDLFSSRVYLNIAFSNISGIEQGDPVVIRGVDAGRVENIKLDAEHVILRISIKKSIPLYSDVEFTIESRELMGGKQIVIYPGESGQSTDIHQMFRGKIRGDLGLLLSKGEELIARFDSVLSKTNKLFHSEDIVQILRNLQEGTLQVTGLLKENRKNLTNTISRLNKVTHQIETDSTAAHLGRLVTDLDSAAVMVHKIARRMNSEEGTVGKLLRDRSLYDQLVVTFTDLDSLITDIKANPKKYIKVSLF